MPLSQDEIEEINSKIEALKIHGWGGACGQAAIQINKQVFDGQGEYIAALNNFWLERDRWVGHVAVLYGDELWDSDGLIEDQEDLRAWGMLDPEDPDWNVPGWDEEAAYDADLYEVSEAEILRKFDICTIVEQLVAEEIATVRGSWVWGRTRNDGDKKSPSDELDDEDITKELISDIRDELAE